MDFSFRRKTIVPESSHKFLSVLTERVNIILGDLQDSAMLVSHMMEC